MKAVFPPQPELQNQKNFGDPLSRLQLRELCICALPCMSRGPNTRGCAHENPSVVSLFETRDNSHFIPLEEKFKNILEAFVRSAYCTSKNSGDMTVKPRRGTLPNTPATKVTFSSSIVAQGRLKAGYSQRHSRLPILPLILIQPFNSPSKDVCNMKVIASTKTSRSRGP